MDLATQFANVSDCIGRQQWTEARFALRKLDILLSRSCIIRDAEAFSDQVSDTPEAFLRFARHVAPLLRSPVDRPTLDLVESRREILIARLIDANTARRLELCALLWRFWLARGHYAEGLDWTLEALATPGWGKPSHRVEVTFAAGVFLLRSSRREEALEFFECAAAMYAEQANARGLSAVYNEIGTLYREIADTTSPDGLRLMGHASWFHSLGVYAASLANDASAMAACLSGCGLVTWSLGEFDMAEMFLRQCAEYYISVADEANAGYTLGNLGNLAFRKGEISKAITAYSRSLEIFRRMGAQPAAAFAMSNLADCLRREGKRQEAIRLSLESLSLRRDLQFYTDLALPLETLGLIAALSSPLDRSARLLASADAMRTLYGRPATPESLDERRPTEEALRAALPEATWNTIREEATALTAEKAILDAIHAFDDAEGNKEL